MKAKAKRKFSLVSQAETQAWAKMAEPFWLWMYAHIILASASTASSKLLCNYLFLRICMYMYVYGYVTYICIWLICWALKRPVHCAEQLLELKICISPQFRAIDPPNPARGFIQQNENVHLATAACMQKYGNVSFVTVARAKSKRYGGGGGPYHWGGGGWDPGSGLIYKYVYSGKIWLGIIANQDETGTKAVHNAAKRESS